MRAAPSTPLGTTWRRILTACVAVVMPLAGLAAPAHAALTGTVTVQSTNGQPGSHASSNTTAPTVVITTSEQFYYQDGLHGPTITFSRHGSAGTDKVTFSISGASGGTGTANSFTGTVDFHLANPGDYDITVSGDGPNDPSGGLNDVCLSCFQVLSAAPVLVSTDTPALAQGGSATVTFSGSRFARGNYPQPNSNYACGSCTAAPKLEFRPTGTTTKSTDITLSNPNSGAVPATATTITKVVTVSGSATPGDYDIYVENTDGKGTTLVGGLTVEPGLDITSVTPATRGQNSTGGEIVITGHNFPADINGSITDPNILHTNGVTYDFVRDSKTQIRFTNVAVSSAATAGGRTIKLTSASRHASVTDTTSFSVTAAPGVTKIDANDSKVTRTYGQGADHVQLTLTGSGFVSGAELSFSPATGITVHSTNVTATTVVSDITIDPSTPTGNVVVSVVNGDGGRPTSSCSGSSCTLVVRSAPTITSIDPNHWARGGTASVSIKGTNLADGTNKTAPTITLANNGGTVDTVVANSASFVSAKFHVASNATGSYDVTITNNDDLGQSVCTDCFSADSLGVTGATASSALNDHVETGVVVTGSGFAPDATVELVKTGPGSATVPAIPGTVTSVPVESTPGAADGTSLTADFDLTDVDPGTYEYRVTNPTGAHAGSGQGVVLTVISANPTISSVSPNSRGGGAVNQTVVITGTNFYPSSTVQFSNAAVHVDSMSVDSKTQITLTIHVDKIGSADNSGTVTVTNTDTNAANATFALVRGPSITGGASTTSPVTLAQGAADVSFQLSGDQGTFPTTAHAQLTGSGSGVSFSSVTVTAGNPGPIPPASDDALSATLHVTQSAGLGAHDVVLVDSSTGGRDVCEGCVVVTSGPTIDSVAPDHGQPGEVVPVTITGSHFADNATVGASAGVTVSNVKATSTKITATFTIPGGATPGTGVDVTVSNPTDGGTQTLSSAFTIIDVPGAPTNVSATAGAGSADVTWTAPNDNGSTITTYTVTAEPTGAGDDVSQSVTGNPAATNLTVTGLTNGVEYTFVVVATNQAGTGPTSDPSNAVTPVSVPGKVTGVSATPADSSADVVWNAPADNGAQITKYTVTAVSPTSPTGDVTRTVTGTPAVTHLTVDGLTNGTQYRFKVFATNSVGDGPESNLSSPVTPAIQSTLTIAKSSGRILYGHTATLSGLLTETVSGNPLAGQTVDLYARPVTTGSFSLIGSYVTGADGSWTTDVSPSKSTVYYAEFTGSGDNGAATTATTKIRVAFDIHWVTPKPNSVITHGNNVVKVKIRAAVKGAQGKLLIKRKNGKVVRIDAARAGAKGFITFHAFIPKGSHRIAVKVLHKGGLATNKTRFILIRAR